MRLELLARRTAHDARTGRTEEDDLTPRTPRSTPRKPKSNGAAPTVLAIAEAERHSVLPPIDEPTVREVFKFGVDEVSGPELKLLAALAPCRAGLTRKALARVAGYKAGSRFRAVVGAARRHGLIDGDEIQVITPFGRAELGS